MQMTLAEVAALVKGSLEGPADLVVSGLKGLAEAGAEDVAFLANPRYAKLLGECRAGVVLVAQDQDAPSGLSIIRVDDPYLAYAQLMTKASQRPYEPLGVSPKAVVDQSAHLGADVSIHALASVGPDAEVGDRVVLHPGVCLGVGVKVGEGSVLHANVSVYHGCIIGKRCIIHAGTVIGSDGFGFAPDGDGYFKIPQLGIVQIDDDVELGALNTVDRAAIGKTWIQSGVKTDNLVQIAHNCVIGQDTLLVAQVGISGSTKLGRHVVLGGQVGVGGHITIGDGVQAAAKSGLAQSVDPGQVVSGFPAMPHRLWLRTRSLIRKLPELFNRVRDIEKRLKDTD